MSVDINEYIEDWLEQVGYSENETTVKNNKNVKDKNVNDNMINDPRLKQISKNFKQLKFDKDWNTKLLTDNFVLVGTNNKRFEKYLTLEMALYNCGYKIREGGLKRNIIKYIKDLTQWEFMQILDQYKTEKSSGKFVGKWDPYSIKNKNEFLREFRSPHFTLEHDNIMISLLSEISNTDFIIFHQNYCIQDLSKRKNDKIIILYKFVDNANDKIYYCSVGLKRGSSKQKKIIYMFDRTNLPNELKVLLNKDEFIYEHVKKIIESYESNNQKRLTLNYIVSKLENILHSKFSHNEIRGIVKIINCILQDKQFFKC